MKAIAAICICALSVAAGGWEFGGKVSAIQDQRGLGFKAAVTAEYRIAALLSWRTDLEALARSDMRDGVTQLSLPSNLLLYPLQHQFAIDPYAGPGLVLSVNRAQGLRAGANILAGVKWTTRRETAFGIEVKYTIVDVMHPLESDAFEAALTGAWEIEL